MVSADNSKPTCPVCHQADKVRRLRDVYHEGVARFAPPAMPTKTVRMQSYVVTGMVLVGICIFCIIVFIGSESFGQGFSWVELALVSISIICIVAALVLSYIAFTKVVKGDNEASVRYAAWDQAVANWERLRYCSRDDVVFDSQGGKTLTEQELSALLSTEVKHGQAQTSLAH